MTNKFGMNIQFADTDSRVLCLERMNKYKPNFCLTYSVTDAIDLRKAGVANVAVRLYEDGGVNEKKTLQQMIDKYKNVAANGFWIELTNEYISVDWLKSTIRPLLDKGWKILAPAFASGTPEPFDWPAFKFMCELYRDFPSTFMFSVHEYFPSAPFNMKIGQWNPNASMPKFDIFVPDKDTDPWKKYLMAYNGRFEQFCYPWCDKWGLPHPKYVVTEGGRASEKDDQNQPVNSGGWTNGWRALDSWYAANFPGMTGDEVYAAINCWLVDVFYDNPNCQGYILFNYSDNRELPKNSQNDWSGFQVVNDAGFWNYYDRWYMAKSNVVEVPKPEFYLPVLVSGANGTLTYFHPTPGTSKSGTPIIGSFKPDEETVCGVDVFGSVLAENLWWVRLQAGNLTGYASFADLIMRPATGSNEEQAAAFDAFEAAFMTYRTSLGY